MDPFLSSTYSPSRHERETIKLARQLEHLSIDKLADMASGGSRMAAQMAQPIMPENGQPAGPVPTTRPSGPPQNGGPQGTGLGDQAPTGMESGMKMAMAKMMMRRSMEKQAFSLAGVGQAAKNVNWGQLARQNAVPLATGAAGAAIGAYEGGKDGGGVGGALGGAALGGLGGAAVGKAGQLGVRALGSTSKGTLGARLKGEVNREALHTQQSLGVQGQKWKPFGASVGGPAGAAAPSVGSRMADTPRGRVMTPTEATAVAAEPAMPKQKPVFSSPLPTNLRRPESVTF